MDDFQLHADAELVEVARAGDAAALESVLRTAWPHAFRMAFAITKDRALAEDAAQEACVTAALRLRSLREASSFAKWFVRITVREALRLTRSGAHEAEPFSDLRLAEPPPSPDSLDLRSAILALPDMLRVPLVLDAYCGLSSKEIGAILHIRDGAVRFRVWRAKGMLREQLVPKHETKAIRSFAI